MNNKFLAPAALVSALLASLCCIGPLVLAALGLGSLGLAELTRYRPVFLLMTVLILAAVFYLVYRRPSAACAAGVCQRPAGRGLKAGLWFITALAVALASFPYWSALLPARHRPAVPAGAVIMSFRVNGMHCAACAQTVKNSVQQVPGVFSANIDYNARLLKVAAAPGTAPEAVLKAVSAAGYGAEYLDQKEDIGPRRGP